MKRFYSPNKATTSSINSSSFTRFVCMFTTAILGKRLELIVEQSHVFTCLTVMKECWASTVVAGSIWITSSKEWTSRVTLRRVEPSPDLTTIRWIHSSFPQFYFIWKITYLIKLCRFIHIFGYVCGSDGKEISVSFVFWKRSCSEAVSPSK